MPSKHVIRSFHNEGYYHIYNRGVAKQNVFMDDQDYKVFLYYLRSFLSPPDMIDVEEPFYDQRRLSYYLQVSLLSYCLMPNHFHMFIKQELDSIAKIKLKKNGT